MVQRNFIGRRGFRSGQIRQRARALVGLRLCLLLSLLTAPRSFAAGETYSETGVACGTTEPCETQGRILGGVVLGIAGLVLPHYLTGRSIEGGLSRLAFGGGTHDRKEIAAELGSFLSEQDSWLLVTSASLTLFNKSIPSLIRYGVGGGYQFRLPQGTLIAELKGAAEKYEALDEAQLGLAESLTYIWEPTERDRVFVRGTNANFFKNSYAVTRADLGYRCRFSRKSDAVNLAPLGGAMVSYEENQFLQEKSVIISLLVDL